QVLDKVLHPSATPRLTLVPPYRVFCTPDISELTFRLPHAASFGDMIRDRPGYTAMVARPRRLPTVRGKLFLIGAHAPLFISYEFGALPTLLN
ncbi:unnamed protein product, partial [Gadus morhua 'NCC']